jgi:hypothetical protein
VAAEVVHDHDVAWAQRRDQHLPDVGEEAVAVDRPVDDHGRVHAGEPETGDEGGGAPMAMGNADAQALAPRCAAAKACHLGVQPGLVDEDQAFGIQIRLRLEPGDARRCDVRAVLLVCVADFF